jgi:hypothetical protein
MSLVQNTSNENEKIINKTSTIVNNQRTRYLIEKYRLKELKPNSNEMTIINKYKINVLEVMNISDIPRFEFKTPGAFPVLKKEEVEKLKYYAQGQSEMSVNVNEFEDVTFIVSALENADYSKLVLSSLEFLNSKREKLQSFISSFYEKFNEINNKKFSFIKVFDDENKGKFKWVEVKGNELFNKFYSKYIKFSSNIAQFSHSKSNSAVKSLKLLNENITSWDFYSLPYLCNIIFKYDKKYYQYKADDDTLKGVIIFHCKNYLMSQLKRWIYKNANKFNDKVLDQEDENEDKVEEKSETNEIEVKEKSSEDEDSKDDDDNNVVNELINSNFNKPNSIAKQERLKGIQDAFKLAAKAVGFDLDDEIKFEKKSTKFSISHFRLYPDIGLIPYALIPSANEENNSEKLKYENDWVKLCSNNDNSSVVEDHIVNAVAVDTVSITKRLQTTRFLKVKHFVWYGSTA